MKNILKITNCGLIIWRIKIMKDLIRTVLLAIAIYSGAIAANSHDYFNIPMALLCGAACSTFVLIKDNKKD